MARSSRDRLYSADQSSNIVSVIAPATSKTLGAIALGARRLSNVLNPQYVNDINVHGLAYVPGRQRLAVLSIASGIVDIVDTATNKVVSHTGVGRAAHEGWFTKGGGQSWVADRGRDTVTIVDAIHGGVLAKLACPSPGSRLGSACQSRLPDASATTWTCRSSFSQAPSTDHIKCRLCTVFHGPNRAGSSRH